MDKFDRNVQRELLKELYEASPHGINRERDSYYKSVFGSEDNLVANLIYLRDHGLIDCHLQQVMTGAYMVMLDNTKITNKGSDFIRDDGGLSAILNVQTIKFHREAVIVLEDLIAISNMNDEQKEKAKSTLGELSTEALKTVVQAATTAGLSKLFGQ
ncbi:hypothetical protein [Klebsiella aerogenes]|uniref:hypothetical protein n=1 Tax=Klebsiella aerogenes TaxID=548 RepID=UPI00388F7765